MIELPAHVEDRLYEIFMKLSVPRLLEKEALEKEALEKGEDSNEERKGA